MNEERDRGNRLVGAGQGVPCPPEPAAPVSSSPHWRHAWRLAVVLWLAALSGIVLWFMHPQGNAVLADFSTSLQGRSPMQRHNARLAARRLDGLAIPAGRVFSFNQAAGPYTRDQGYKKAPVSFSGEIVITWGGGVCQVSTTLYNAALLAGLEILEREPHVWAPQYIAPGRDAAVAYGLADLRFRNPYDRTVRLRAAVEDDRLHCALLSRARPAAAYRIVTERCELLPAVPVMNFEHRRPQGDRVRRHPGYPGFQVRTYRLVQTVDRVRREWLSEDSYLAMSPRVEVGVGE